jgi:hypothetical protein
MTQDERDELVYALVIDSWPPTSEQRQAAIRTLQTGGNVRIDHWGLFPDDDPDCGPIWGTDAYGMDAYAGRTAEAALLWVDWHATEGHPPVAMEGDDQNEIRILEAAQED